MKIALITYSKSFIKEVAEMIASAVGFTGRVVWDMTKPNGNLGEVLM